MAEQFQRALRHAINPRIHFQGFVFAFEHQPQLNQRADVAAESGEIEKFWRVTVSEDGDTLGEQPAVGFEARALDRPQLALLGQ